MIRLTGRMSAKGTQRVAEIRARALTVAAWMIGIAILIKAVRWW